jgi:hypothetical protein
MSDIGRTLVFAALSVACGSSQPALSDGCAKNSTVAYDAMNKYVQGVPEASGTPYQRLVDMAD